MRPDQRMFVNASRSPRRELLRRWIGEDTPLRGLERMSYAQLSESLLLGIGKVVVRRVGAREFGFAAARRNGFCRQDGRLLRALVAIRRAAVDMPHERPPQVRGGTPVRCRIERDTVDAFDVVVAVRCVDIADAAAE